MAVHNKGNGIARKKVNKLNYSLGADLIALSDLPVGTSLESTDLIPYSDLSGAEPVSKNITVSDLKSSIIVQSDWDQDINTAPDFIKNKPLVLGDYDANVDYQGELPGTYASIAAAVAAGKSSILLTASGDETGLITFTTNTTISYYPKLIGINIIGRITRSVGVSIYINGATEALSKLSYVPSSAGASAEDDNGMIYGGNGNVVINNIGYQNNGNYANTPLLSEGSGSLITGDFTCVPGLAQNAGVRYTGINSRSLSSLTVSDQIGAIDALVINNGNYSGVRIICDNFTAPSRVATIAGENVNVSNLIVGGSVAFSIDLSCNLENVSMIDGSDFTLNLIGSNAALTQVILPGTGKITVAGDAVVRSIMGSVASVYTVENGGVVLEKAGNNSVIGNDYHETDEAVTIFDAAIDSISAANHYPTIAGEGGAYEAGKKCDLVNENVTETSSLTIATGDQVAVTLSQGITYNIGANKVVAAGSGCAYTLQFADQSSIFSFAMTGTDLPFNNFDTESTLNFNCNGGTIQNNSAVTNTYITCDGDLFMSGAYYLLPNQYHGGVKTNPYADLLGVWFEGAGGACEICFEANGGNVNGTVITGSFKDDAVLVLGTSPTFIRNTTIDINGAAQIEVNGLFDGLTYSTTSELAIRAKSNSICKNIVLPSNDETFEGLLSLITPANASNIIYDSIYVSGAVSMSSDNSNDNITYLNCIFTGDVVSYGTNVNFLNCTFLGNLTTSAGSTGCLNNCNIQGGAVTISGSYLRAANDSTIGNDYSTATIGTVVQSSVTTPTAITAATNEAQVVTSITLATGKWIASGVIAAQGGSFSPSFISAMISANSSATPSDLSYTENACGTSLNISPNGPICINTPIVYVDVGTSQDLFLKIIPKYTLLGDGETFGSITAYKIG